MGTAKEKTSQVRVLRQDPSAGHRDFQTYEVPFNSGWSVMNALLYIYENLDTSLAVPYTCLQGRCMGCAVQMDGHAICACAIPMKASMTLEALPRLPVIRDLVVEFKQAAILYDATKCEKCHLCVKACPINIWCMSAASGLAELGKEEVLCIGCRECEIQCEENAITIQLIE